MNGNDFPSNGGTWVRWIIGGLAALLMAVLLLSLALLKMRLDKADSEQARIADRQRVNEERLTKLETTIINLDSLTRTDNQRIEEMLRLHYKLMK